MKRIFADRTPINKGKGENFIKDVNFIIEVKTGTSSSNYIKGFGQALKKSKEVSDAVPVVAMDHHAYRHAIKENPALKEHAKAFIKTVAE